MNKDAKKYLKKVNKNIACKRSVKRNYMQNLKENLIDFSENNPNADYQSVCERFGSPEQVSEEFLESLEPTEIKKAFKRKKIIFVSILAFLLIFAVLFGSYLIAEFIDSKYGYVVEEEPIEENVYINEKGELVFEPIN